MGPIIQQQMHLGFYIIACLQLCSKSLICILFLAQIWRETFKFFFPHNIQFLNCIFLQSRLEVQNVHSPHKNTVRHLQTTKKHFVHHTENLSCNIYILQHTALCMTDNTKYQKQPFDLHIEHGNSSDIQSTMFNTGQFQFKGMNGAAKYKGQKGHASTER